MTIELGKNLDNNEARVATLWKEYAEVYPFLIHSTAFKELVESVVDSSNIEKYAEVLDLGAGTGNVTDALLKKNPRAHITALDNSREMITHLEGRYSNDPRVSIEHEDLGNTDMWEHKRRREEKDGLIVSNLVLPYVTHFNGKRGKDVLPELVRSIYGILSDGGTFVWSSPKDEVKFNRVFLDAIKHLDFARVPGQSTLKGLRSAKKILDHANEIAKLGEIGVFYFPSVEEIVNIMESNGFVDIDIKESFVKQANVITGKKV